MSNNIPPPSQPKQSLNYWNGSDELDVFEAARYFSGATENFITTHKNIVNGGMRPTGRMSLDMATHRSGNSIPLQAMLTENPNNEKKSKQPRSPGGKLAHFLNSLFNNTSSKKSKSKKDEDESPNGWRRKRRSSISHFGSGKSNSITTTTTTTAAAAAIITDSKSPLSTSTSSSVRTPPSYHIAHTPTKTTSYPPTQITKTNESFKFKLNDLSEKKMSYGSRVVEEVKIFEGKQDERHPHNYVSREDVKEFKRFTDEDDGDSDSSSDLFELSNCDLGYYTSGLPVYETTHMDTIKRGAPISS